MESNEIKFLLKLLGCSNYRSLLSTFNSFKDKSKICRSLSERKFIDFSREITGVKITAPGRTLLKMEPAHSPASVQELKILGAIAKAAGKVTPSKISVTGIKAPERDSILHSLAARGLVEVETGSKKQKAEVWLTQQGQDYLRDDFTAKGIQLVISLDLLTNYVCFLRKSFFSQNGSIPVEKATPIDLNGKPAEQTTKKINPETNGTSAKPTDEAVFQAIQDLDREFRTDNYLPIFHLREKLQPSISREELDQALYRLQRNEKISFSTLVEPWHFTPEQVDAGIPQVVGGPLFFIITK